MTKAKQVATPSECSLDDYIHAVGRVTLEWNNAELALDELIWLYLEVEQPTGRIVTRPLSANAKVELLGHLVKLKEFDDEVKEHVNYATKCWNHCRENRNHIVHGVANYVGDGSPLLLKKHRRKNPSEDIVFEINLKKITKIYKDIQNCTHYLIGLRDGISLILTYRQLAHEEEEKSLEAPDPLSAPLASLKKPPIPKKLSPSLSTQESG